MRTLMTITAATVLFCAAACAEEETPRTDRAKAPAAAAEAAPRLADSPVEWKEVTEALKQGSGAIAIFFGLVLLCVMGWGLLACIISVSPNLTERVGKAMHASHLKCFLVGICAVLFLVSVVVVSHQKLGGVVGAIGVVALAWGVCGVAEDVGRRAWMLTTRDPGRFAKLSLGWPALFFGSLVPLLGWFMGVVLCLTGVGAFFIALMSRAAPAAKVMPR